MSSYYRKPARKKSVLKEFKILIVSVAIFWAIEIADYIIFNGSLDQYGIKPRDTAALWGILLAPMLHGGFGHLMANTVSFIPLGWLTMLQETSDFYIVSLVSALVGGVGVWIFGAPNSVHIGASILIYGYLGFLLLRGYFQKNIPSIILSFFVAIVYGGLIWGVFPNEVGISWEGHLFGFIGGAIAAKAIAQEKKVL
ncbi:rhomboid family intramembrane serine protease [Waterburya agarophytonicola K14]|uniref:Rhomboid family intramembrane serine protease n=1 Tax=Waterburya agarophytonicola KI4 TaxID=2874699 RepID=A0A964FGX2_9CYAN|nr:rhomboid family intramembrane serine protease [Waterburya agarophytonicola]MCC0179410.1 rhomboid family intramembrane serine protease [Waterburya agarophytonicola KI4]